MVEEVYIVDVIQSVANAMQVQIPGANLGTYFTINYQPGMSTQILRALENYDGTTLDGLKYPLLAVVMPIPEDNGSGFLEVRFPRIVIAYLTKNATNSEPVLDKYLADGVFKTILRPCEREFIKQLAFSTYTSMGDPGAYEYTANQLPSQQAIGKGVNDFVEIIEILNLKATIFPQIKTC